MQSDTEYYRRRLRQELEQASTCEDNAAALAHLKLADAYRRRANGVDGKLEDAPRSAALPR